MRWIVDNTSNMRSDIETYDEFISRNLEWWRINEAHERASRRPYYVNFVKRTSILDVLDSSVSVAEVGPGPFGGILEVCNLHVLHKTFVDYALIHLVTLGFVKWPHDATYVHAAAENIPLQDDVVDLLLSYNAIDHGWDTLRALDECVRVSKMCCVSFDCRGDSSEEVAHRVSMHDKDHVQLMRLCDVEAHVNKYRDAGYRCEVYDLGNKPNKWPVATVVIKKHVLDTSTTAPTQGETDVRS